MFDDTYLFIDGAYLRGVYRDLFNPVFGEKYEVDYSAKRKSCGAVRAFYYDCIDEEKKQGETDADLTARVQQQEDSFRTIERIPGVQVRPGHLRPTKKGRPRQKEVDVLLAVDMLTNAFSKNMGKAVLLAGDRDFRPVVESVVRLGTWVNVAYEPCSASKELYLEADEEQEIDLKTLCKWIKLDKHEDRGMHFPWHSEANGSPTAPLADVGGYRSGVIGRNQLPVGLVLLNGVWHSSVKTNARDYDLTMFREQNKLLGYLSVQWGEIKW